MEKQELIDAVKVELAEEMAGDIEKIRAMIKDNRSDLEGRFHRIEKGLDKREIEQKRMAEAFGGTKIARGYEATSFEERGFGTFLRKGREALEADEVKQLRVSDDPRAGYLAPPMVASEILRGIAEFSPIRQIARVVEINRESLEVPKRTAIGVAVWVGETGERTADTSLKFGRETLTPFEMSFLAKVTLKMLEDSAYPLETELAREFADAFAILEGAAFVTGDSSNKPEGLLVNASIAAFNSESAADITPDGVIGLPFQIKSGYLNNGRYLLNRTSLWKIRTFKDPVSGVYLWQPAFQASVPATICGFPYTLCPDLPDPAAGAWPVLFGDFQRGYMIVDRVDLSIQRLSEKYAEFGQVGFLARRRVGGQVVLAEAIVKLKCAVT